MSTEIATEIDSRKKNVKVTVFIIDYRRTFVYYMKKYNGVLDDLVADCLLNFCRNGKIVFANNYDKSKGGFFVKQAIENELKSCKFSDGILLSLKR